MNRFTKFAFYWLPAILYAGLILFLSSQSHLPGQSKIPDKPVHLLEYLGFAIFLSRAVLSGRHPATFRQMLAVLLLAASFAAFDEFYQSFIPGRTSSVYDWAADVTGIGLAITLLLWGRSKEQAPA